MGDFNFPTINWDELSCSGAETSAASSFLDAIQDCFLVQHVTDNTRFRHGQLPSLMDLIFTVDPSAIMWLHIYPRWEVVIMPVFFGSSSALTSHYLLDP